MALRTARRLIAAIIPFISLGLLITSLAVDDWYSAEYLNGEKTEGSLWQEYRIDYGIYDFHYLKLWSDILGETYKEGAGQTGGDLEELGDYTATSMVILILIHLILIPIGFLAGLGKIRTIAPMMIAMIILLGSVFVIYNYYTHMGDLASDHMESGLPPLNEDLDGEIVRNLSESGKFGPSFGYLLPVPVMPLLVILLLIDPRRDRDPDSERLKENFFKEIDK